MTHTIKCKSYTTTSTIIDNTFIDKYMIDANGSYVKVYLLLAMHIQSGNTDFSISCLADRIESTEADIMRALQYWEKKQLLSLQWDENSNTLCGLAMLNPNAAQQHEDEEIVESTPVSSEQDTEAEKPASPTITVTKEQTLRMSQNDEFNWLSNVVESYLNRPLNPGDINLLMYLYDTLKFSPELLLHLYDYCVSLGKTNTKYIQAIALSWHENGITTPEEAQQSTTAYSSTYTAISKALAIGRSLAVIEKQYVDKWTNKWQMDLSVVLEACNRTMLKLQKADFKYTDGILDNWHRNNIHTLQDVEQADAVFEQKKAERQAARQTTAAPQPKTNQFSTFQQRTATRSEVNELEKKLLMH